MVTRVSVCAPSHRKRWLATIAATLLINACQTQPVELPPDAQSIYTEIGDVTLPVSCLLPGQIRKLGTEITYLSPRRQVITSAMNCQIRGGEYVHFDRAEYETALKVWLQQARSGDPRAQSFVGEIYEKGLATAPNYELARGWYRKAAAQDYTPAQIRLGLLHEKGLGVPQDHLAALNWYRTAAGLEGNQLRYAANGEARNPAAFTERQPSEPEAVEQPDQARSDTSSSAFGSGPSGNVGSRGPTLVVYGVYDPTARSSAAEPVGDLARAAARTGRGSIVGRVTAPAGIASVKVNERPVDFDARGAFSATVPVGDLVDPVRVVAIDTRGKTANVDFYMNLATLEDNQVAYAQSP